MTIDTRALLRLAVAGCCLMATPVLAEGICALPVFEDDFPVLGEEPAGFDEFGDGPTSVELAGGLKLRADEIIYQPEKIELSGNVILVRGDYAVATDELFYDPKGRRAWIDTGALVRTPVLSLKVESLDYDLDNAVLGIEKLSFSLPGSSYYGSSERASVSLGSRKLDLERTNMSRCPGENPTWSFRASRTKLDVEKDLVRIYNPVLRIKGVPLFWLPYLSFPASGKPSSGLLPPNVAISGRAGLLINLPYYWRINDQNDMTLSPSLWTISGIQYNHQYRFLSRYLGGVVNFSVLDSAAPEDARPTYWGYDARLDSRRGFHEARLYAQSVTDRQYALRYSTGLGIGSFTQRYQLVYRYDGDDLNVNFSYGDWRETFYPADGGKIRFDDVEQRPRIDIDYDVPGLPVAWRLRLSGQWRDDMLSTRPTSDSGAFDAVLVARNYRGRVWLEYAYLFAGGDLSFGAIADYLGYDRVDAPSKPDDDFLHQLYWDWRWEWLRLGKSGLHQYSLRWKQLFNPERAPVISEVFGSHLQNWIPTTIFSSNPYVGEDYVPKQQVSALMLEGEHRFGDAYPGIGWSWRIGGRLNNAVDSERRRAALVDITAIKKDGTPVNFEELPESRSLLYHSQSFESGVLGRFDVEYAHSIEAGYDEWLLRWNKSRRHNLYDFTWRRRAEIVDQAQAYTRIRMTDFWYLNLGARYDFFSPSDSTATIGTSYISCCLSLYVFVSRSLFENFNFGFKIDLFSGQNEGTGFNWSVPNYLSSSPGSISDSL